MWARVDKRLCEPEDSATLLIASEQDAEHAALDNIFDGSEWRLCHVGTRDQVLAIIRRRKVPVVICARDLPDGGWKAVVSEVTAVSSATSLIVCSRPTDEHLRPEVLRLGGFDVLPTPFETAEVFRVTRLGWHSWQRRCECHAKWCAAPWMPQL